MKNVRTGIRTPACGGLLALLVFCAQSSGQLTLSTVRGAATDPTGAVVAKAAISLTNIETNAKREVVTGDTGDFEIPDLQPGTYRLSATAAGFLPSDNFGMGWPVASATVSAAS